MDDPASRDDTDVAAAASTPTTDPADAVTDELADTAVGGLPPRLPDEPRRPGETIGRYVIEKMLGAGGVGIVYAARDPDLDRRVALKLLHERGERPSLEAQGRFLREARAMARIEHANVITVHEIATAGGVDLVAMELIDGSNLAEWLRAAPRRAAEVMRVFQAAGRGLAAAHAAGIVHRDFKPANVMVGRGGRVVVTDFGLARSFTDDAAVDAAAGRADPPADVGTTITHTGALLGTPAYMAPEQFAGAATDARTDQYAFAMALWEGLAGARPFPGTSMDELRRAAERGPPVDGGRIPRRIRRVLVRGLAPDPSARWPDLEALLTALDRAERRPRRIALAGIAAVAIAGIALVVVGVRRGGGPAPAAACAISDADLEEAWSPALAARVGEHFAGDPAWDRQRAALDRFASTWRVERAASCASAAAPSYHGRIACLLSMRDELGALTALIGEVPVEVLRNIPLTEILGDPAGCRSGIRAARPPLPDDPVRRAALSDAYRDGFSVMVAGFGGDLDGARRLAASMLERARASGDPLIHAMALHTAARVEEEADAWPQAEAFYAEAATQAERAGAGGARAGALVGQLECFLHHRSDLTAARELAARAQTAIDAVGGDRTLEGMLGDILADIDERDGRIDDAIARTAAARAAFAAVPYPRGQANSATQEAELRARRGGPGDAARAVELRREAVAGYEATYGPEHPITVEASAELAAAERALPSAWVGP